MNSSKIWRAAFCSQFANISLIFLAAVIPDLQWYKTPELCTKTLFARDYSKKFLPPPPNKNNPKKLRLRLCLVYFSDMEEQKFLF